MKNFPKLPTTRLKLPEFVRAVREYLGWKPKEIADHLSYPDSSRIRHWESSNGRKLERIPEGYLVTLLWLCVQQDGHKTMEQTIESANKIIGEYYLDVNPIRDEQDFQGRYLAYVNMRSEKRLKKDFDMLSNALNKPKLFTESFQFLMMMIPELEREGYRTKAEDYLKIALKQNEKHQNINIKAELFLRLARVYQLKAEYDEARNYAEQSLVCYNQLNDSYNQARALNSLAYIIIYCQPVDFEKATQFVELALSLLKEDDEECGFSHFVLGVIALEKYQWEASIYCLQKALEIWQKTDNQWMMGRAFIFMGSAQLRLERHEEAKSTYQKAIKLLERTQAPFHKAIAQMNLGIVCYEQKQFEEARKQYFNARNHFDKVQDIRHLAHVYHNLGMVQRCLGNYDEALDASLESEKLWKQIGNIEKQVNTLCEISAIYRDRREFLKVKDIIKQTLPLLETIKGSPTYQNRKKDLIDLLQEIRLL